MVTIRVIFLEKESLLNKSLVKWREMLLLGEGSELLSVLEENWTTGNGGQVWNTDTEVYLVRPLIAERV